MSESYKYLLMMVWRVFSICCPFILMGVPYSYASVTFHLSDLSPST